MRAASRNEAAGTLGDAQRPFLLRAHTYLRRLDHGRAHPVPGRTMDTKSSCGKWSAGLDEAERRPTGRSPRHSRPALDSKRLVGSGQRKWPCRNEKRLAIARKPLNFGSGGRI
ncbi:hypothetical protein MCA2505 [Methylococcus capsulatus str. Bath]|uniref:Uncharacterized protein n=1 Tax=Methylococcus capsulatus (strain ATCC 33009 / NCIMB 11132 / Bath) TaxID=243233 RepID=Q604N4_METCA|nr:hypothetical protein MCA2505 [Methylococcus capsulatus str. Bath]